MTVLVKYGIFSSKKLTTINVMWYKIRHIKYLSLEMNNGKHNTCIDMNK